MKLNIKSDFSCPNCKGILDLSEQEMRCRSCQKIYPIENDIVDFRINRLDYFFNPVSSENMNKIIAEMNKNTWVESIKSFISLVGAKQPESWIDNLVTDSRYAWKIFLDLNKDKTVLDIGCGLGNLASNLAPHVSKTYAIDLTYKRLEFAKKRISIFNANDDVEFVAGGDGSFLPFSDNSVDCVTLSGVLEWVGEGDSTPYLEGTKTQRLKNMLFDFFGKSNPREIQISFLKEIKRILKNDGQLFIGIENRLNYEYFTGRPDHHSNLMYASLLPRFVANIYSIIKSKKPYRTYTYSIHGYTDLLKSAGFEDLEFIGLVNGYSFLNAIYPAENNDKNWERSRPEILKDAIKYNKYFVPAYGIIASRNNIDKNRLQNYLFLEIKKHFSSLEHESFIVHEYLVTQKEKLVITATIGNKKLIIKVPFNSAAVKSEESNMNILNNISHIGISPCSITKVSVNDAFAYVEELIDGKSLANVFAKYTKHEIHGKILRLLDQINSNKPVEKMSLTGALYNEIVENPIQYIFDELPNQELNSKLKKYFKEKLYGKTVTVGITHGDMSISNIFVDASDLLKLIDWEVGSTHGLPIMDVINYLGSEYRFENMGVSMKSTVEALTSTDFINTENGRFLADCYDYFGVSIELHDALVYLNWMNNICALLPFSLKYNKGDIDKFIFEVAEGI